MEQRNITGQAFRVLVDAANSVYHRISLWTHSNDVEMPNGDNLTVSMSRKYNMSPDSVISIHYLNELSENTCGCFEVDPNVGTLTIDNVSLFSGEYYTYYAFSMNNPSLRMIIVMNTSSSNSSDQSASPLYIFRWSNMGWRAFCMSSERELNNMQRSLEIVVGEIDRKKYGYEPTRVRIQSDLGEVPMNTSGTLLVSNSNTIGYYDKKTNITTSIMPGEYAFFSCMNSESRKFIVMFSNTVQESGLLLGGGYVCTHTGSSAASWVITRIVSPTDFSTDETGLREQIVTSLTGQLWPVGSIYLNLSRTNPGDFLGGTWNLITEGILTAVNGSPEQTGYHQRDLYKAVQNEDRGEHLYGVFAWQRIA